MPIANYSVLKGRATAGKVVSGSSAHYQIIVVADRTYTVAVNIQSVDRSEVLYAIHTQFTPPNLAGLEQLPSGMTPLQTREGGLALDFVREKISNKPMITRGEMALLPIAKSNAKFLAEATADDATARRGKEHALQNAVVALLNAAVADPGSVLYAFGSAFSDGGVVDGIHDIHMNQGNPSNNHGSDNGIWQDGALFLELPGQGGWTALFIAFQTQSWMTDASGNPVSQS